MTKRKAITINVNVLPWQKEREPMAVSLLQEAVHILATTFPLFQPLSCKNSTRQVCALRLQKRTNK